MTVSPFILASASPRRLKLLQQIGLIPDQVLAAEIDEQPGLRELPIPCAERLAAAKGATIAERWPEALILAADTVVACGRRILPKAEDEAQARACLKLLSGRRHRVHTALLLREGSRRSLRRLVTSQVKFKRLEDREIEAYLESGEWQGKAGGYAIQGRAAAFITFLSGSYSNVVGLPLAETAALLREAGRDIWS